MSDKTTLDNFTDKKTNQQIQQQESVFGESPEDWEVSNLNNSRLFRSTSSGLEKFSDSKIYIPTAGVEDGQVVGDDGHITYDSRPSRANLELSTDDVIFAKMKDSIKVLRASKKLAEDYVFSTGFIRISPKDNVSPEYLKQVLLSSKFNQRKDSLAIGSTQPAIRLSDLSGFNIPIPPIQEQRKIATVLYTIDRAIEKTERVIGHYENLQTGLLRKHFGKASVQVDYSNDRETKRLGPKSYAVPKDWETVQISDVGKIVTGDTPPTKNEDYYGGDLPFVTPEDFGETKRVYCGSRGLTDEGRQKSRPIPEEAVMMDCIGMDMGKVRIAGRELATNQQINSIIVNKEMVLPEFLYFHLKAISNLIQSQAGQTRTPIVSKSQFSSFEIFKPPISAQEDVVNSISVFDELIEKESEYVAQLRRLKRGLMQDLLSGTVRTTDTNIEVPEEIARYG